MKNATSDPMDHYSKPIKTVQHKLATQFFFEPRLNPQKQGRELVVNFDSRFPLVPGFVLQYSYYVRFFEAGNTAGNHYHKEKKELFIPIVGDFTVTLENIETKERETIELKTSDYSALLINTPIAHAVTASASGAVLLVLASSADVDSDEYDYRLV